MKPEWNDIYDEDRQPTGRVHLRGTPWKPGEYGLVVCVWVYDGRGRLLLTRRSPGKSFAGTWENSGGAAKAVEDVIHRLDPEREVKTVYAEGLRECRKMLKIARTGKYDGYLLEGMACPGGCIAGAGTIQPPEKSRRVLEQYKSNAPKANPLDSDYKDDLYLLHDGEDDWSFVGRH